MDKACGPARQGPGARIDIEATNLPGMRCQERHVKVQIKAEVQYIESQMHDLRKGEFVKMLELQLRGQVAEVSNAC